MHSSRPQPVDPNRQLSAFWASPCTLRPRRRRPEQRNNPTEDLAPAVPLPPAVGIEETCLDRFAGRWRPTTPWEEG